MNQRQRNRENPTPPASSATPPDGSGGNQLDQISQQAAGFATAANAIISRALSSDSQAFLQANRQQGGQ